MYVQGIRTSECLLEIACWYTDESFWWAQNLLRHISPLLLLIAQLFRHLDALWLMVSMPRVKWLKDATLFGALLRA